MVCPPRVIESYIGATSSHIFFSCRMQTMKVVTLKMAHWHRMILVVHRRRKREKPVQMQLNHEEGARRVTLCQVRVSQRGRRVVALHPRKLRWTFWTYCQANQPLVNLQLNLPMLLSREIRKVGGGKANKHNLPKTHILLRVEGSYRMNWLLLLQHHQLDYNNIHLGGGQATLLIIKEACQIMPNIPNNNICSTLLLMVNCM